MTAQRVVDDVIAPARARPASLLPLPVTESELLRCTARGNTDAFAQLYDLTASRVHGLALRVVRDAAQAEEVTQEVFLEVWQTASRFDPGQGGAVSWLMTLTHRRAVDRVRGAEASRRRDTRFHDLGLPGPDDPTADTVASTLEAEAVRAALSVLSLVQREAIELAYYRGHTYVEVASLLGVATGTVKSRIRDGLIRLRVALQPAGGAF